MGDNVESLIKVKVNDTHYPPLRQKARTFITEGYQVGQAWFTSGKSMLAICFCFSMCPGQVFCLGQDFVHNPGLDPQPVLLATLLPEPFHLAQRPRTPCWWTQAKKALSTSTCLLSLNHCSIYQRPHIFLVQPFTTKLVTEALLFDLDIPWKS